MITEHNPLLKPIAAVLVECKGKAISEYQLLGRLVKQKVLDGDYARQSLSLFQAHFLTMNALYQLRQRFRQSRTAELSVSPLAIVLQDYPKKQYSTTDLSMEAEEVARYYLDWSNFNSASEQSVDELLHSFWHVFVQQGDKQGALQTLGLKEPVSWNTIKQAYRRLVMQHHPDRDGDPRKFNEIQQAYGELRSYYCSMPPS